MKQSGISMAMALTAMACFFGGPQSQAANTFTAISGSDWNTAANWSEGVPAAGQEVVINGDVMLTNATPLLISCTLNAGATQTFNGWDSVLNASVVTINGTMTHAPNTDSDGADGWTPNVRVNIACDTLTVSAGGKIDVTGKGFAGKVGNAVNGCGPGAGKGATGGAGGGGYGGLGGGFSAPYGLVYGSPDEPEQPDHRGVSACRHRDFRRFTGKFFRFRFRDGRFARFRNRDARCGGGYVPLSENDASNLDHIAVGRKRIDSSSTGRERWLSE